MKYISWARITELEETATELESECKADRFKKLSPTYPLRQEDLKRDLAINMNWCELGKDQS